MKGPSTSPRAFSLVLERVDAGMAEGTFTKIQIMARTKTTWWNRLRKKFRRHGHFISLGLFSRGWPVDRPHTFARHCLEVGEGKAELTVFSPSL